jgi:hypothetical protein
MFILHLEKYYRRIVLLSHVVFISVIGASSSNTGKSSSVSQQGVHPSLSWVFMQATDGSFSELEGVFIYVTGVSSFGSQKCLLLSSRVVLFWVARGSLSTTEGSMISIIHILMRALIDPITCIVMFYSILL